MNERGEVLYPVEMHKEAIWIFTLGYALLLLVAGILAIVQHAIDTAEIVNNIRVARACFTSVLLFFGIALWPLLPLRDERVGSAYMILLGASLVWQIANPVFMFTVGIDVLLTMGVIGIGIKCVREVFVAARSLAIVVARHGA